MGDGGRLARWRGLVGVAIRRTLVRTTMTDRVQTWLAVAGVAVSVALMLLVTSVGVGLADQSALHGADTDFAIVPEGGHSSVITDVENARLGGVHAVSQRLEGRDDVVAATPVRTVAMEVTVEGGEPTHLLLVGVIPSAEAPSVAGLSTHALTEGDPYYADGSYDGRWTGEAVVSEAGADALGAGPGDRIAPAGGADRSFTVTAVEAPDQAGLGQFPVAVVHLAELQAIVGGTADDSADQLLVVASDSGVEEALKGIYPHTTVVSQGDLFAGGTDTELPKAIAITAFVVAVAVGTLFTMTTLGFELAAGARERAVMAAVGISRGSRTAIVVVQALVVAALGGVAGVLLWLAGLLLVNAAATTFLTELPVAAFRPELAGYGLLVAFLIGLLTVPYLLVVGARTKPSRDLLM